MFLSLSKWLVRPWSGRPVLTFGKRPKDCWEEKWLRDLQASGQKNVLRKLLRIPCRRLKARIFCVLTVFVCCWSSLSEMHEVRMLATCKAFLFDKFAFFSSLENYFGFRTTNVKGKTDHSVSLRWNKRFWTFLKRRVFFLIVHSINLWVDFAGLN